MVWSACVLRVCSTTQMQGCQVIVEGTSVWNRVFLECSAEDDPHSLRLYPHPKVNRLLSSGWMNNNSKRGTQGRFIAPDSRTRSLSLAQGGKLDLRESWSVQHGNFLKFCQDQRSQISFGHKVLKEKGYTVRFEYCGIYLWKSLWKESYWSFAQEVDSSALNWIKSNLCETGLMGYCEVTQLGISSGDKRNTSTTWGVRGSCVVRTLVLSGPMPIHTV